MSYDTKSLYKSSLDNIVVCPLIKVKNHIYGSSNMTLDENMLPIKIPNNESKYKLKSTSKKAIIIYPCMGFDIGDIGLFNNNDYIHYLKLGYIKPIERKYKLNKTKLRSKIAAYFLLKKSQKFCAFYSISFPNNMKDETIRKIHNTVLTRLRKTNKDFTYIWVAERQGNGTLHFHMLTNQYFNIRIVNHMYKMAIDTQLKNNDNTLIKWNKLKYNGVDVKPVKSKQNMAKYLSKYVTKNNTSFNGLVWNCDSSVSSLTTHLYLSADDFNELYDRLKLVNTFDKIIVGQDELYTFNVYSFGSYRPKIIFDTIAMINNYTMKYYHENKNL